MSKLGAFLAMAVIAITIAAGDAWILTRSAVLSRLAREEIHRQFGDVLEVADVRASWGGVVILEGVKVRLGGPRFAPQEADQITIDFRGRLGGPIRRIVVDGARLHLSPELFEELSKGESKRSIRDLFPNPDELPQIVVRGDRVQAALPEAFPDGPQALLLEECTFTPEGSYRGHVRGALESRLYGFWTVDGEVDGDKRWFRLRLEAPSLVIRPAMRDPLAPELKRIYEKYLPGGKCGIQVEVWREPGRDVDFAVTLHATEMQLNYKYFPYQAERMNGEIEFLKDSFRVKYMTAMHGGATIRFAGRSEGYPEDSEYHFRLEMDNVPLDADLRAALKPESQKAWDRFGPSGLVSARATIDREGGKDKPTRIPVEISARGTSLNFKDFPYEVRHLAGDLRFDGDDVRVGRLVSKNQGATIEATGEIHDLTGDATVDLSLDLRAVPLDERLKKALPEGVRKAWDSLSPTGALDARLRVTKEQGKDLSYQVLLRARGNSVKPAEFPVLVTALDGEIELAPGQVHLRHLTGQAHGARVGAHGTIASDAMDLDLDVVGLAIDDRLKDALPPEAGDLLKQLRLGGVVRFMASYKSRKGGQKEFTVDLKLSKGVVDTDPKIEEVEGHVALEGIYDQELLLRGPIAVSTATVAGKRVTDVGASLNVKGPKVNFVNIKATGYGGLVAGRAFTIDTKSGAFFCESLTVDRLDLREYSLDTQGYAKKTLGGKVSLSIQDLAGRAADAKTIRGKGRLTIRDGLLWDVPVLASIFTLNPQDLFKPQQQFDTGAVDFEIKDRKFVIDKLSFSSESVSLLGRGTVDFDGNLDLVLKTKTGFFGIDFLPINIVTGLFDELKGAFHGVAVTGTFEKPVTSQKLFPGK